MNLPDSNGVILRRWSALIRTAERDAYLDYVGKTGLAGYAETAGNMGCQMLSRDMGDGTTEVTTLSWWSSPKYVEAFAGQPIDKARYYPEDDRWLVTKPERVEHHVVVAGLMA